ncbi:MAG: hypothetical protein CMI53_02495 [Parcubacteria group bacterium]|nr:hypothetical protein [Parcubacteria group bacterium]|tara:strand:+ start:2582 stop:3937 length:1356 start_codon:yes stop_codon:yes gene_type:complete
MSKRKQTAKTKAWIVSVDMGYGHQRAAFPLKHLAYKNEIITVNNYSGIPSKDRKIWRESRKFYESISRFKKVPVIGKPVWDFYDKLQEIPKFYPKRDLSKRSLQTTQIYRLIEKGDWGKHLISQLSKKPIPLVTTFFIPAFMAEVFNYPGEIYCLTTDADINRAWAPKNPASSRIKYFAPNIRVVERLKRYGVSADRIFLTGFPLPQELTGDNKLNTLKKDLAYRLVNLDPKHNFHNRYHELVEKYLDIKRLPKKSNHPLTLMFAVGGAGAQRDIGATILKSFKEEILNGKIRVVLVAGIHNEVSKFFRQAARSIGLNKKIGSGIKIIFSNNKDDYFKKFNVALKTTDILWTKPSELSFYSALGIPIVMAPPIGSQEKFNRRWLQVIGCAIDQDIPQHSREWLMDWVDSGWFAEAAIQGFVEAPKFGTYNIEKIIAHQFGKTKDPKMILQY